MKRVFVVVLSMLPNLVVAQNTLITFDDGRTLVACELANTALESGFFEEFDSPRIVGECPVIVGIEPVPTPFVAPLIPRFPPIAPWCDCTDEELRTVQNIFSENLLVINPGFGMPDQQSAWGEAYGLNSGELTDPEYWPDNTLPDLDALRTEQFLKLE